MEKTVHIPVLPEETLRLLDVAEGDKVIDATFGGGGFASFIMRRGARVLGIDCDMEAVERGRARFAEEIADGRLTLVYANHADLGRVAVEAGFDAAAGIVMDLGVSSDQIDDAARGFSFSKDGPLDMRLDASRGMTAAEWIATASETDLSRVFKEFGEEKNSKQIARAIVRARGESPVTSTSRLASVVETAAGRWRSGRNPAVARIFQACRYLVSNEVGALEAALGAAFHLLMPGGRLVIISFESITDRIVKQAFARHVWRREALPQGGWSEWRGEAPAVERLTRRVVTPSDAECRANPRARPAKLRACRRLADADTFSTHNEQGGVP